MNTQEERLAGAGPWTIKNESILSADETHRFHLGRMEHKGQRRYFAEYVPMDDISITNTDDANAVEVMINNQYPVIVQPNQTKPYGEVGIEQLAVTNFGSTDIAAEAVLMEVSVEGYDADEAAREQASQSQLSNVVERFTGLNL